MKLNVTRNVHAAVTISSDTSTLVIDPGEFGFPDSVYSAQAVLVTHDHFDHVDKKHLSDALERNADLEVYSPTALHLAADSARQHIVHEGSTFEVGDIPVGVVGQWQATASVDDAPIPNVGFLIASSILHPGDAHHDLHDLDLVFTALAAPWQNSPQLEQHLRAVTPRLVIGTHDITLSDIGRDFAQKTLAKISASYGGKAQALAPGESIAITTSQR